MNMKKLGALLMALVMMLSLSVTAFAATLDLSEGNTSSTQDVYGKVVVTGSGNIESVYSVDVTWGSMKFTYTIDAANPTVKWDPDSHKYESTAEGQAAGTWSCDEGADNVTVKNHSDAAVKVAFSYSATNVTGVTVSLKDTGNIDLLGAEKTTTLDSAVGTPVNDPPAVTGVVSLSGDLPYTTTSDDGLKIGTLTVTLSEVTD